MRTQLNLFDDRQDNRTVGKDNALAAVAILNGATREQMRKRFLAGEWPDASPEYIRGQLKMAGR